MGGHAVSRDYFSHWSCLQFSPLHLGYLGMRLPAAAEIVDRGDRHGIGVHGHAWTPDAVVSQHDIAVYPIKPPENLASIPASGSFRTGT